MICFCSILYYKNLSNHINHFKIEKRMIQTNLTSDQVCRIAYFTGRAINDRLANKKIYNTKILNKWHLLIMLDRNKSIIRYRKVT
jgi:hypothetical protein